MNIGILGLGYVGLTLAIAAADHSLNVYGTEINEKIKGSLKENKAHFFEPGLDELIKKHNNKTFHVVEKFSVDIPFDAFIITVGTPLKKGEKQPNFDYIRSALSSLREVYTGDQLIILRSTVSVGTTRNIVLPFLAELCHRPIDELLVSMCPERTVEGKAIEELTHLPQVISGNNKRSQEIASQIFSNMTSELVLVDNLEEAELVKLYCNTYRDMNFAIGNAFCMAAQAFGVDGTKVIKAANHGYKRSNIALPGFVAGPCLEKDAYILTNNMPDCDSRDFILSGRHFNESLEDFVVDWVYKMIGEGAKEKVITLSGMAFKGQPETSDLRGSSSVYIAEKLKAKGYTLHLHDYVVHIEDMQELGLGTCYSNLYDACADANLMLVLNNHKTYTALEPDPFLQKEGFALLDTWGVCEKLASNGSINLFTLGNLMI